LNFDFDLDTSKFSKKISAELTKLKKGVSHFKIEVYIAIMRHSLVQKSQVLKNIVKIRF